MSFAAKAAIIEDCLDRKKAERAALYATVVGYAVEEGETYCVPCWNSSERAATEQEFPEARVDAITFEHTCDGGSWSCSACGLRLDREIPGA